MIHYNDTADGGASCEGYTRDRIPVSEPCTRDRRAVTCPDCIALMEAEPFMGAYYDGFDRFTVGQQFVYIQTAPWRSPLRQGIERTASRIEITKINGDRFDYVVRQVLDVVNPLPTNPRGAIREGSTGGMTCDYAIQLLDQGTLKLAGTAPPDGYVEVGTGGGCTAWQRDLYDPHTPGRRIGEVLITAAGDAQAPTSNDEPVSLGIYDVDQNQCAGFDCDNVAQAVLIASKFVSWS